MTAKMIEGHWIGGATDGAIDLAVDNLLLTAPADRQLNILIGFMTVAIVRMAALIGEEATLGFVSSWISRTTQKTLARKEPT